MKIPPSKIPLPLAILAAALFVLSGCANRPVDHGVPHYADDRFEWENPYPRDEPRSPARS